MKKSAGILVFRKKGTELNFFLVHPGGPFWKNKQEGSWSIPKGEYTDEDPLEAARREFLEETGQVIEGEFILLDPVRQKGGKLVTAFAVEGAVNADNIRSNTFKMEWPYKSGNWQSFPEIDDAGWFDLTAARKLINPSQAMLLDDLLSKLEQLAGKKE